MADNPNTPIYPNLQSPSVLSIEGTPAVMKDMSNQPSDFDRALYASQGNLYQNAPYLKSLQYTKPALETPLDLTLRYTDPTYGYSATNPDIESQYADRQSWTTGFGNNLLKFGATTAGSILTTFATIPYGIKALTEGKLSDIYNNPIVNGVSDFQNDLENTLPNFQTNYEQNHPFLSAFNPLHFKAFTDTWGNVLKNLGFTAGAIASSIVVDTAVGAMTGGVGDVALIPEQATNILSGLGKLGKIFGSSKQVVGGLEAAATAGEDVLSAVNRVSQQAKVLDNVKYGINLFTSTLGESTLEAQQTYVGAKQNLIQDYIKKYGEAPTGSELNKIELIASSAGNTNLVANAALLSITNSIALDSFLKPTTQAIKQGAEAEVGAGINIARSAKNIDVFEKVVDKASNRFQGILKWGKTAFPGMAGTTISEGFEEGAQFFSNDAIQNYVKRKYDDQNTNDTDNLFKSLATGFKDTLFTTQGQQNIFLGGLSGGIIHFGESFMERRAGAVRNANQLAQQHLDMLNSQGVTGLFQHTYDETLQAGSIKQDMDTAAKSGNIFEYKNLKSDALFNYVNSGAKTNRFDLRIGQLEALKDLNSQQFETLFQIQDSAENRRSVSSYVDSVIDKAKAIKTDINKVDTLFKNPYNYKSQHTQWAAFDSYKDALSYSLNNIRDNKQRINSLSSEIQQISPLINVDKVVQLTNDKGVNDTIDQLNKRISDIKSQKQLVETDPDITEKYNKEQAFLEDKVELLKSNSKNYDHEAYIKGTNELFDYYANNNNLDGQNKIDISDSLGLLNKGQDIWKLGESSNQARNYYNTLASKDGYGKFIDEVSNIIETKASRIEIDPNGNFRYIPLSEYNQVKTEKTAQTVDKLEEAYNNQNAPEETTPEEKQQIKDIVEKENKGEELTPEEKIVKEEKKTAYTNRKKAVARQQEEEVDEQPFDGSAPVVKKDSKAATTVPNTTTKLKSQTGYSGATPNQLFNRVISTDFSDGQKRSTNLFTRLFKKSEPKNISNEITVSVQKSTKGKSSDTFTKITIPNTKLYRRGYDTDIVLKVGDNEIGQLQDNLYFNRDNNKVPISELTASEYQEVTNNDLSSYDDFMSEVKGYQEIIDKLKAKDSHTNAEFKSIIGSLNIFYGVADYVKTAAEATLIKDAEYQPKNSYILSFPWTEDHGTKRWSRSQVPNIIGEEGIMEDLPEDLHDFLTKSIDQMLNLGRRYIAVYRMPDGSLNNSSPIAARPATRNAENIESLFTALKSGDTNLIDKELSEVYIADSNNGKGIGNSIKLKTTNGDNFVLNIENKRLSRKNISKNIPISKELIQTSTSFQDLLEKVQRRIEEESTNDSQLRTLNVKLDINDFKADILQDENVNFNDLKDKLTITTTPKVFKDFSISVKPKINEVENTNIQNITNEAIGNINKMLDEEAKNNPITEEEDQEAEENAKQEEALKAEYDKLAASGTKPEEEKMIEIKKQIETLNKKRNLNFNTIVGKVASVFKQVYGKFLSPEQREKLQRNIDFDFNNNLRVSYLQSALGINTEGAAKISSLIGKVKDNQDFYRTRGESTRTSQAISERRQLKPNLLRTNFDVLSRINELQESLDRTKSSEKVDEIDKQISRLEERLDKNSDEYKRAKYIIDNFDKITQELEKQGSLEINCK